MIRIQAANPKGWTPASAIGAVIALLILASGVAVACNDDIPTSAWAGSADNADQQGGVQSDAGRADDATTATDEKTDLSTFYGNFSPPVDPVDPTLIAERPAAPLYAEVEANQVHLIPTSVEAFDEFGWSVDVDGGWLVSGAPLHDMLGDDSGAAWVYRIDVEGLGEPERLLPEEGAAGIWFGRWVAVDGDTIVVGAPLDDNGAGDDDSGAAYVFIFQNDRWTQQARLSASDWGASDQFGWSVDIDGDLTAITAFNDDLGGEDSGSLYIFRRSGTTWTEEALLIAGDPGVADWLGYDVGISGDTVVVGAIGDDVRGDNSGAAYIFSNRGGDWAQETKLKASDTLPFDEFGRSVAIDGDTILVSAHLVDTIQLNAGAVYVYERIDGEWEERGAFVAEDAVGGESFGYAVAMQGKIAVVGAPYTPHVRLDGERTGAAYLFERTGDAWTQVAKLYAVNADRGDDFGWAAATDGRIAVVGAWFDDTAAGTDTGSAYLFPLPE